jgi:ABC-2 type transport system ATP-binding protein
VIQVEHVSKAFRRTPALDDVSLRLAPCERVALVGANGAGKTTLIRCLLGEYSHAGRVTLDGLSPRSHRADVLQRVGFVPQLPPPLKMPVSELVQFAAGVCASDPERIGEVSERLGLDAGSLRGQAFVKLSGGQKQKLLIAIALGRDSDFLILDEPAANLDPAARRSFFELLAERAASATMLISSHRLDEVAPLVQRVVELDRGRVTLDDRVAESGGLADTLRCRLELASQEASAVKALRAWGFEEDASGSVWTGEVAGADRLRFFGMLSRYSGWIRGLRLETPRDEDGRS